VNLSHSSLLSVSPGKFRFFISFLLITLLAALHGACSNPVDGKMKNEPEPAVCTVTFNKNGGDTEAVPAAKTVTSPATTIDALPVPPTRTGYGFVGWNSRADGSGSAFTASTTVSADITVYAQWTAVSPGSYTVTFKLNDGTDTNHTVKTVTSPATAIAAAEFPANPSRAGYTFVNWNSRADGTGSGFTASTTVSADITVYAQWTAVSPGSCTVTFKLNDGTDTNHTVKTVTSPATTIDALPAPPIRTGYGFAGWNTAQNGSGSAFTASTTVSANITVYAQWTAAPSGSSGVITLNPDAGAGAFGQTNFTVYKSNGTGSRTVSITGSGYTDPRWFVDGELKGTGNSLAVNAADYGAGGHILSLEVKKDGLVWSKEITFTVDPGNLVTVIFRANNGTGAIHAVKTAAAGSAASGFPAAPARTGYGFTGWNTRPDGSGTAFTNTTTVNTDTVVYAQWNPKTYTVTFDKNGGDTEAVPAAKTVTVPAATVDALPAPPVRSGYNFAGWNTQANGSGTAFGRTTAVSSSITVYAQWAHKQFDITLNLDAGAGAFSQGVFTVYKSGGAGSRTLNITGSGYTNPRWFVDGELKGTESSLAVSAVDYGAGGHTLSLIISRSGVSWSKEITFTVDAGTLRTVIFRANDGTGAIHAIKTPAAGSAASGFPGDPARTGYGFTGWNTQPDGSGAAFTASTVVSADMTVYAQWNPKTKTVTFNKNGGETEAVPAANTVTVPAATVDALPAPPTRTGYNFAGWNTAQNGSGTAFGQTTAVSSSITVYAQWAHEQFNITLNPDAGAGAFSQGIFTVYKSGGAGSRTLNIAGSGYTSPRWFVDGELKGTESSLTVNAADYGAGGHTLSLIISRSGVSWSKEITFTVQ
jgi:uncharacterized repeat protein (TIGR02543 family)